MSTNNDKNKLILEKNFDLKSKCKPVSDLNYMEGEEIGAQLLKTLSEFPDNPAIIAPTIITDEIALVTDISGVCNDGVTLQTT